ncbi:DUF1800 domain-containing protein [Microbacterium sp. TNHR37B]|uniref:DUF1800 domain-containing protein n=1 Tax=Microbacterium sp. TNHR37B TaxID=1775956 RepID=UPI0008350FF2|nr:DUF1800 domain-containing protein [Microbacterium sp. TNHR37B]
MNPRVPPAGESASTPSPPPPLVHRRSFLGGIATASAAAVALPLLDTPSARAADGYAPIPYPATPVATKAELHVIRRWTYGFQSAALAAVRAAGGPREWLEAQLTPEDVAESPKVAALDSWWRCITSTPDQIVARDRSGEEEGWHAMAAYAAYALVRRQESNRQVLELMTEFWEDHFYIPIHDDGVFPFRISFGHRMRELALSSFEELLQAATVHPAMGCSLDNARSTKRSVNENLGRELLELHTVGKGAGYSENDVKASARLLTGYRVDMWTTWESFYDPTWHDTQPVKVMGFSHANASADGRPAVRQYLSYLARHPSTAQRIARKLARRFVSDSPSTRLVDHLAATYLRNDTRIAPVLRALFDHDEFWASAGAKVKTPTDELVSMNRALGVSFGKPTSRDTGALHAHYMAGGIGAAPWSHPRPDGPPLDNDAWNTPSRFLASWDAHWTLAGGWWPTKDTTHVPPAARLPKAQLTLGEFVDHLSRQLTGVASTESLLRAICTATQLSPATVVTAQHSIVRWQMPWVLALVLNQPLFYLR